MKNLLGYFRLKAFSCNCVHELGVQINHNQGQLTKIENEVTLERRQILKISCDIDKNRSKLNKIKKDKMNNMKKLDNLNQQIQELQAKKAASNEKVLTAEEKAQEVENILAIYEKQHDQLKSDLDKQKVKSLKRKHG